MEIWHVYNNYGPKIGVHYSCSCKAESAKDAIEQYLRSLGDRRPAEIFGDGYLANTDEYTGRIRWVKDVVSGPPADCDPRWLGT